MLPDEPIYPQVYPATFTDAFGTEETVIINDGIHRGWRVTVRGVEWRTSNFGHWWLGRTYSETELARFEIGPHNDLQQQRFRFSFRLSVLNEQGSESPATLHLQVTRGNPTYFLHVTFDADLDWSGSIRTYHGFPSSVTSCLEGIQARLPPGNSLKTCQTCEHFLQADLIDNDQCVRLLPHRFSQIPFDDLHTRNCQFLDLNEQELAQAKPASPWHWCPHFSPRLPDSHSPN